MERNAQIPSTLTFELSQLLLDPQSSIVTVVQAYVGLTSKDEAACVIDEALRGNAVAQTIVARAVSGSPAQDSDCGRRLVQSAERLGLQPIANY